MQKVFIVCGYVASGKTTVADAISNKFNASVIRTDDLRKGLFPQDFNHESMPSIEVESWIKSQDEKMIDFQQVINPLTDKSEFTQLVKRYAPKIKEQKEQVYEYAFQVLENELGKGNDVLFDATFSSAEMRERVYRVASSNGIKKAYIIQVVCNEEAVVSRLANRVSGNQDTTSNARQINIFRKVKEEFDASQIQNDNPVIGIKRIVYDTGKHTIVYHGKGDKTVEKLKSILFSLSQQYGGT